MIELNDPSDRDEVQVAIREFNQGVYEDLLASGVNVDHIIESYLVSIWILMIARYGNLHDASVQLIRNASTLLDHGPSIEGRLHGERIN